MRTENEIAADIMRFSPVDGNWLELERLLDELWRAGPSAASLGALFGVFERFPDEDGAGVFWSIVHGLEHLDIPHEAALRESLARRQSEMGEIMLHRLDNARR
ncbi:hypothetical protein [Achromobacter insuavis]|uniref:hypothetical protein n=1 Tax=Achromobacter insuavis TaxID=1287735 RepID=UPI0029D71874|nr:hypothetical protein [Achromobacter sp.]